MATYVLIGKYSNLFDEGMIHTPQDRMKVVEPMLKSMGAKLLTFLFMPNNPENDFVATVETDDEMKLMGGVRMVHATGTFSKINSFRAYDSVEMKKIFQMGHNGMESFVSAKQGAGIE